MLTALPSRCSGRCSPHSPVARGWSRRAGGGWGEGGENSSWDPELDSARTGEADALHPGTQGSPGGCTSALPAFPLASTLLPSCCRPPALLPVMHGCVAVSLCKWVPRHLEDRLRAEGVHVVMGWPGGPGAPGWGPEVQGRVLLTCCDSQWSPLLRASLHLQDRTQSRSMTEQPSLLGVEGRPERQPGCPGARLTRRASSGHSGRQDVTVPSAVLSLQMPVARQDCLHVNFVY